jgi:hypothetical protein
MEFSIMCATLALLAAVSLTPAQADSLELKNVRFTQSALGATRADNKFLPGDLAVLSFDVDGLQPTGRNRVRYSMGMELSRKGAAKPDYTRAPDDQEAVTALGGTRLPLHAVANIGTDTPPGTYVMKVTVNDRVGKGTAKVEREFEVLPARLGFVRVGLSYNAEQPAPPLAATGQTLYLNFGLVGFARDKETKHPDLTLQFRVLDAAGKPTTDKPVGGTVKKVKEGFEDFIPFDPIAFQTHRAGQFRIVMSVTDNLTKKTAESTLNLTIQAIK